ncbi:hypothetical protein GCM10011613_32800 [Cellvibrio zantedeschiae]|uniref:PEP-CTERM protein-sorting domain-containing protein n=2 Tax=Cellvibrio zantedeschiae TaxID=1237077 RepID=A0ABQ3BDC8_9GAMM|nr:hypothetical protein GCM10011613_32800 [Cellvibrio zantedeschiae]
MSKKIGFIASVLFSCTALTANAASIPYNLVGTEAPANSFIATATGQLTAYFYATEAAYNSEIGVRVNGVSTGVYGLWNHGSAYADSIVLGNVNAGDLLEFELRVLTTSTSWYSTATNNADGKNHTYTASFAGDAWIPAGRYIAFEDLPSLGDFDYDDHQFVVTNVALPEPTGLGLLGIGLITLGLMRRRKSNTAN